MSESGLVLELGRWRREMSPEVRMVFDHQDRYAQIITVAADLSNDPTQLAADADAQADYASRLADLAGHLDDMDDRVDKWQGAARVSFDETMGLISDRVRVLHELSVDSSRLLQSADRGRLAIDRVLADLVRSSIDHAERSLTTARALTPMAGATAMATWTSSNLRQVANLLDELVRASQRVNTLFDEVTMEVNEVQQATTEVGDELARIGARLGR